MFTTGIPGKMKCSSCEPLPRPSIVCNDDECGKMHFLPKEALAFLKSFSGGAVRLMSTEWAVCCDCGRTYHFAIEAEK